MTLSGLATLRIEPAISTRDTEVAPPFAYSSRPPRPVDAAPEPIAGADDRYEIGAVLGEGGMGEVRLCHDRRIGRDVAMKIAKGSQGSQPDLVARFLREVRIQGQLEHPGVVPVYDLGVEADGRAVFTMKRVRGRTLEEILDRSLRGDPAVLEAFPRRQLLAAFSRACLTVAFAHSRGVVHRDLKPANLMLGDFGEVYVLDWGIAKVSTEAAGPASSRAEAPVADDPAIGRTEAGSLLGTPGYMAPEQAGGAGEVGVAADVYALGCILFEILSLTPLHRGQRATELILSTLRGADARPSARVPDGAVPPELDAICVRATALDPQERHAGARELAQAVDRVLDGERDTERRRELAAEHVRAARAAMDAGTAEGQREAVRELGRALALDPTDQEALATLRATVLAPGAELPPEAEAEFVRIDHRDRARAAVRIGVTLLGFPLASPLLVWMGVRHVGLYVALIALSFCQAGYALYMGLTHRAEPRFMRWFIVFAFIANATIVVEFGPYILGPVLAALTAATFLVSLRPNALTRRYILGASVASVVAPALLDGVLYRSTIVEAGELRILPFLTSFPEGPTRLLLILANVGLVIATNYLVGRASARLVDLERRNFGQAWRLRHLLPQEVAPPPTSATGSRPSCSPSDPTA